MKTLVSVIIIVSLFNACVERGKKDVMVGEAQLVEDQFQEVEYELKLIPDIEFTAPDDVLLGYVSRIEADSTGRVFMADHDNKTIHVFNPDGSYLTNFGRQGVGPGEFQSFTGFKIIESSIFVFDRLQYKVHEYDLDNFQFIASYHVREYPTNRKEYEEIATWIPMYVTPRFDSTNFVSFMAYPPDHRVDSPNYNLGNGRTLKYYLVNYNGKIISDKLFEIKDKADMFATVNGQHMSSVMPVPFLGKSILRWSHQDQLLYTTWTSDFKIDIYDTNGEHLRSLQIDHYNKRRIKTDREELIPLFTQYRENSYLLIKKAELPDHWPVIYTMEIDSNGNLWVLTITDQEEFLQWWVFDKNGKLLTRTIWKANLPFEWLRHRPEINIEDDALYVRAKDENETDKVIKYKFVRE